MVRNYLWCLAPSELVHKAHNTLDELTFESKDMKYGENIF